MQKVIVYKQENGSVALVIPTQNALLSYTVMEIAVKDVPFGKPFKICNISDLPNTPQEEWVIEDFEPITGIKEDFPVEPEVVVDPIVPEPEVVVILEVSADLEPAVQPE
jgi:hypothetical protein